MIGLLFGLLHIGGLTAKGVSEIKREHDSKKHAIESGSNFYTDRHGNMKHVENDEPFMITKDWRSGDAVEVNPYTHKIVKNITQQNRMKQNEAVEKAKENGERYVMYDNNLNGRPHYPYYIPQIDYEHGYIGYMNNSIKYPDQHIEGKVWKNTTTYHLYVKREINTMCQPGSIDKNLPIPDGCYCTHGAIVYMDLRDAKLCKEDVLWTNKNTPVTKEEIDFLNAVIDSLNKTDENGRFVNRYDIWLNNAHNIMTDLTKG